MKRRGFLIGTAIAAAGLGAATWLRPADVTRPHDAYFSALNDLLKREGPGHPVMLVDRARMRRNVDRIAASVGPDRTYRVVVKSLPSVPLLAEVMARAQTRALMVFHVPFLTAIADAFPDADVLMGKPMPIDAVRNFYARNAAPRVVGASRTGSEGSAGAFDPARQLQWLVDTPERLAQYAALARELDTHLRINVELDVGLHRGGVRDTDVFAGMLGTIDADPDHLSFSGLMGYEPHLTGVADGPEHPALQGVLDRYRAFVEVAADAGHDPDALTLNGAGSHTLRLYEGDDLLNDLSAGSGLVMPTDFDTAQLADNEPALFIATPILKRYDELLAPAPGWMTALMQWWNPNRRRLYFTYGGYWKAKYVSPSGVPEALYHSTNQEPLSTSVTVNLEPDDWVFLRPTQSEFVMLQFGDLRVVEDGCIAAEWPVFEGSTREARLG